MEVIRLPDYERHLDHSFYKAAEAYDKQVTVGQIRKGAEKYPEPFNPDSWSNEELAVHAFQEIADLKHYAFGMRDRMKKQQLTINYLLGVLDTIANANVPLEIIMEHALKATEVVRESKGLFIDERA